MTELDKQKKEVLKKFYGGKRESYMHNFRLSDGICEFCGTFIEEEINKKTRRVKDGGRLCNIITPDEVANFNL